MDENTFVSFEDYKKKAYSSVIETKLDKEQIISDAEEIKKLPYEIRNFN